MLDLRAAVCNAIAVISQDRFVASLGCIVMIVHRTCNKDAPRQKE